jgi:hypothetical protein
MARNGTGDGRCFAQQADPACTAIGSCGAHQRALVTKVLAIEIHGWLLGL